MCKLILIEACILNLFSFRIVVMVHICCKQADDHNRIYRVSFLSQKLIHTLGLLQKDDMCFTPAYEGFGVWVCIAKICSYACM